MQRLARSCLLFAIAISFTSILSIGCNTTEGAGKDIKATGRAIENAASDAKN